jgi:hypothetical protein
VRFVALKPDAAPEYCCSTIGSSITLVPLDRITTRQKYIRSERVRNALQHNVVWEYAVFYW